MSRTARLALNTASNAARLVVATGVWIALTPVMLREDGLDVHLVLIGPVTHEAWAAGCPAVAARVGGVPGFVRNGTDGRRSGTADAVRALAGVLVNRPFGRKLGHAGRMNACTTYDGSSVTARGHECQLAFLNADGHDAAGFQSIVTDTRQVPAMAGASADSGSLGWLAQSWSDLRFDVVYFHTVPQLPDLPADLGALYRAATVVAVPSRWPEPCGMVGLQAMHHARPVVDFDVGGIRDWLDDGRNGGLPVLVRRLTQVITVSEASRRDIVEFTGVAPERISVVPLAANHERFTPERKPGAHARIAATFNLQHRYIL